MGDSVTVEETKQLIQEAMAKRDWVGARLLIDQLYVLDPDVSLENHKSLLELVTLLNGKDETEG